MPNLLKKRVIRVLVYEGNPEAVDKQLSNDNNISGTKHLYGFTITETFRGTEQELQDAWRAYGEDLDIFGPEDG